MHLDHRCGWLIWTSHIGLHPLRSRHVYIFHRETLWPKKTSLVSNQLWYPAVWSIKSVPGKRWPRGCPGQSPTSKCCPLESGLDATPGMELARRSLEEISGEAQISHCATLGADNVYWCTRYKYSNCITFLSIKSFYQLHFRQPMWDPIPVCHNESSKVLTVLPLTCNKKSKSHSTACSCILIGTSLLHCSICQQVYISLLQVQITNNFWTKPWIDL